jgi:hypothetical protein
VPTRIARACLEDPGSHEVVQSPGQRVRGDPETALKVREPGHSREHRIANDEQASALTDDLGRAGSAANLTLSLRAVAKIDLAFARPASFWHRWIVLERNAIGHENRRDNDAQE